MVKIADKGWETLELLGKELNIDVVAHVTAISLGMALGLRHPEYATAFCSALAPNDQGICEEFMKNVPLEGILTPQSEVTTHD